MSNNNLLAIYFWTDNSVNFIQYRVLSAVCCNNRIGVSSMYTTHFRFVYVPKPRVFFGKRALHCFSALLKTKMLFFIFLKRLYCRYHDIFNRFEFQQTVGKTKFSLSWYPTGENKISYLFLKFLKIYLCLVGMVVLNCFPCLLPLFVL